MSGPSWESLAVVMVVLSLVAFVTYGVDKWAARSGRWRVSERTLLLLGVLGGWPGAWVAQRAFRHKTVKAPFQRAFRLTVGLHVAAVGGLAWWWS